MKAEITRVCFTYALPGGMWIERVSGDRSWETFEAIAAEVGHPKAEQLKHIATHHGMTGMWYNAKNGRNVYVNGIEVN